MGNWWSEVEKGRIGGMLRGVLVEQRGRFIVELEDGKIGLPMCAWIAKAVK